MDNKALYKLSYGLFLISAKDGVKDNGCIVNTVIQATSNPLTLTVAVNKANYTSELMSKSGCFNVSVLSQNVPFEVFERFGFHSGRDVDKLKGFSDYKRSANGLFYIYSTANAYFSCKIISETDMDSHILYRAEVTDMEVLSSVPSVTYNYYQSNIKPKPQSSPKTGWRCTICGYVYEGEVLPEDFVCPICKHGAADFVKIE